MLLLLMTRLNGAEVVVGKLAASLLGSLSLLLAALPLFLTLPLFGGVAWSQVAYVYGVTLATIVFFSSGRNGRWFVARKRHSGRLRLPCY